MLVGARSCDRAPSAILDYCGGGVVALAGGGESGFGLVLGGGGGFCSGAPPGCELGEVAGGAACWSDGGVLGLDDSLDGELDDESAGLLDWCEHAPRDSASAAAHSNDKLRFISFTSERVVSRRRGVASRVPPESRCRSEPP
jgi:hypothetical protein